MVATSGLLGQGLLGRQILGYFANDAAGAEIALATDSVTMVNQAVLHRTTFGNVALAVENGSPGTVADTGRARAQYTNNNDTQYNFLTQNTSGNSLGVLYVCDQGNLQTLLTVVDQSGALWQQAILMTPGGADPISIWYGWLPAVEQMLLTLHWSGVPSTDVIVQEFTGVQPGTACLDQTGTNSGTGVVPISPTLTPTAANELFLTQMAQNWPGSNAATWTNSWLPTNTATDNATTSLYPSGYLCSSGSAPQSTQTTSTGNSNNWWSVGASFFAALVAGPVPRGVSHPRTASDTALASDSTTRVIHEHVTTSDTALASDSTTRASTSTSPRAIPRSRPTPLRAWPPAPMPTRVSLSPTSPPPLTAPLSPTRAPPPNTPKHRQGPIRSTKSTACSLSRTTRPEPASGLSRTQGSGLSTPSAERAVRASVSAPMGISTSPTRIRRASTKSTRLRPVRTQRSPSRVRPEVRLTHSRSVSASTGAFG